MDKLTERLEHLRGLVEPAWSEARSEDALREIRQRQLQSRFRRQAFIGSLSVSGAAVAALLWFASGSTDSTATPDNAVAHLDAAESVAVASHEGQGSLTLADHSVVTTSSGSQLAVLANQPKRIALKLRKGAARFDVVPDKAREFLVHAGDVEVAVLGTVFDVEHVVDGVRVSVDRGRVQVSVSAVTRFLTAGQSATFQPDGTVKDESSADEAEVKEAAVDTAGDLEDQAQPPHSSHTETAEPKVAWRTLAKAGDYEAAYRGLRATGPQHLKQDPASLLDAADAARFSGHAEEAIGYLQRVTSRHSDSPMAPLAAFTQGRVCLDQLGQPHRAAEAFALAYKLSPRGSLAQDALARQVEALSKGGREREAYEQAKRYLKLYPDGRRVRAVRLYGGLD